VNSAENEQKLAQITLVLRLFMGFLQVLMKIANWNLRICAKNPPSHKATDAISTLLRPSRFVRFRQAVSE
jgi:hypothetical protein